VNDCPKGVADGWFCHLSALCLSDHSAAIAAKYGVSLADCDWLRGCEESLLTVTNLVTVVAARAALTAKRVDACFGDELRGVSWRGWRRYRRGPGYFRSGSAQRIWADLWFDLYVRGSGEPMPASECASVAGWFIHVFTGGISSRHGLLPSVGPEP
jgi:hypothetical protein